MHTATGRFSLLCLLLPLFWSTGSGISCDEQTTCDRCITLTDGDAPDAPCMWCVDEMRIERRCQSSFEPGECQDIQDPRSSIGTTTSPPSAVMPTAYSISLRPGDPLRLPIDVTTVRNLPLDVYILFDLTSSLRDEIAATRNVSSQIIGRLQEITSDVRVGFGGFADKTVRPYTRINLNDANCAVPPCFNFRHYGPITDNSTELLDRINSATLAENVDAPEAGLDAIAQVALCEDNVGWRESSVKIILYFTDDAFHFAGEGRYAGIMKPFEEVCQLEGDLETQGFEEYIGLGNDYTSPGEVLSLLEKYSIIPVFIAVLSQTQRDGFYSVFRTHEAMAELFGPQLAGASAAALPLEDDDNVIATNILDTIDEQVLIILRQTRLDPQEIDGLTFSVDAMCPQGATSESTNNLQSCSDVGLGNTTQFNLTLTLQDCDVFGSNSQELRVRVFPVGVVRIQIEPICMCECGDFEVNSDKCNRNGNFSCGACTCNAEYCGLQCQFSLAEQSECPRGLDDQLCSGTARGTCLTCECFCSADITTDVNDIRLSRPGVSPVIVGDACECDSFRCLDINDPSDTVVCSGRGDCCNEMCICGQDEDGNFYRSREPTDCECEPAELICRESINEEICGGRGECDCKTCVCNPPYTGTYCEEVMTPLVCTTLLTDAEAEECILYEKDGEGRDSEECQICQLNSIAEVSCVVVIPENEQPTTDVEDDFEVMIEEFAGKILGGKNFLFQVECQFIDEDDCTHSYYILYNKNNISEIIFVAEAQRTCPSASSQSLLGIPLWALAVILLGVLLILGIVILVIIKAIFMILDYIEVKRLEKEVGLADFSKNQNPLYQSPDVEYKNVAYGKE